MTQIIASDGADLTNLAQTLSYDGSGNVSYIEVVLGEVTYRQTITRNGTGQITNVSRWVKQ